MNGPDERDQSVERLLRESLRTPPRGATDTCLDAEVLAAWAEGGLAGQALERADAHLATCGRCQAIVGALVRTDVAAQPEPEAVSRRWLAWLVPLTAAAAAVAVWVAVPRDAPQTPPPGTAVTETRAAAESPPDSHLAQPTPAARVAEADAARKVEDSGSRENAGQVSPTAEAVATASAPPAAPSAQEQTALDALEATSAPGAASKAAAESPAPAAAPAAASAPASPRAFARAAIVIPSPDPAVRWRLTESTVEYSTNGGTTWAAVLTGSGVSLLAGAAPTPTVCWVVGRDGAVWLSADGRPFVRVPFPEATDLGAIRARDARTALVSTTGGRIFATTDGGVTWTPRPLQDFQTAPF